MAHQLYQVGLVDLLESDPRPTFVVAVDSAAAILSPAPTSTSTSTSTSTDEPTAPTIAYSNPSLISYPQLLDSLSSHQEEHHQRFWQWIIAPVSPSPAGTQSDDGYLGKSSFWHLNLLWSKSVVRGLWVVVGANDEPPASERPPKMLQTAAVPTCAPDAPLPPPSLPAVEPPTSPLAAPPINVTEAPSSTPADPPQPKPAAKNLLPTLNSYLDHDQLAFLDLVSSLDWAATPIGREDVWPSRLRELFYQIMIDSHPMAIYWGEDRVVIYNHAFSKLCGSQHPHVLGKPAPKSEPETEGGPQSPLELFTQQNELTTVHDEAAIFSRDCDGYLTEAHVNSSIIPIFDAEERVAFMHSLQDVTESRLWERRMNMLSDLSDALLEAQDVKSYWQAVLEGLKSHGSPHDVPLAALYSVECRHPTISESSLLPPPSAAKNCRLEGALDVPAGHPLVPDSFDLSDAGGGLGPKFKQAFDSREVVFLQTSDGTLPTRFIDGVESRGFGDQCTTAVICPIQPTKKNDPMGLLLVGLNSRRPFDTNYKRYVSLMNKKLSAYLASAILLESSVPDDITIANGRSPEQEDTIQLSPDRFPMPPTPTKLRLDLDKPQHHLPNGSIDEPRSLEMIHTVPPSPLLPDNNSIHDSIGSKAAEPEKLQRMTDLVTVGISETDLNGRLLVANKTFFELCGIPKVDDLDLTDIRPWDVCVPQDGKPALQESLDRLIKDGMPQTVEMRLNTFCPTPGSLESQDKAPRWVLATFMPLQSPDGSIHSIHGCFSDVSSQKWQVESERRRKEEALESKRQQENFMDMTSHEMRNPLGAITHCADAIASALSAVQEKKTKAATEAPTGVPPDSYPQPDGAAEMEDNRAESSRIIDECIDNAETIIACAQHQKRIIDDLLTVSKLDSKLVAVTPCTVDPVVMVRNALKMFEVEAKRIQVDLKMTVDESFTSMGHEYFDFDPSRAKQVLINLLTNALKFTKNRPVRNVSVFIKASKTRPTDDTSCVRFMPPSSDEPENPQPALIGRKNPVYLTFEVKDSGRGLSAEEMRHLFNRFQQASSFTHVKHGGSGLGLFISRRLTELQNGAIGVSSAPRSGSTFVFFIEAYLPSEEAVKETALAVSPGDAAMLEMGRNGPVRDMIHRTPSKRASAPTFASRTSEPRVPTVSSKLDGILVVEDNVINQQVAQRGLLHKGFRVDVANDGLEALEKLQASRLARESGDVAGPEKRPVPFDLVLMDVEMPVQDGLTCARKIRELEASGTVFASAGGRIPIIAVSAHARREQVLSALGAGCDDVLVKPYRMIELLEKIEVIAKGLGAKQG